MKRKIGIVCMLLGIALLSAAVLLLAHNEKEAKAAEQAAFDLMPQIIEEIQVKREEKNRKKTEQATQGTENSIPELPVQRSTEMLAVEIDGYKYIGYLSIANLHLELPVMESWDYPRLRVAPCRYAGSVWSDDLVVMAHNYERHFGQLSKLSEGDAVSFVDMEGNVFCYEVVAKDVLDPAAIEEMTAGDFDLTLFTCTYGGAQRVTIYCDLK